MGEMSDSDRQIAREILAKRTAGRLRLCATEPGDWTRETFLREMAEIWDNTVDRTDRFWMLQLDTGPDKRGVVNIAIIGNGPDAQANAEAIWMLWYNAEVLLYRQPRFTSDEKATILGAANVIEDAYRHSGSVVVAEKLRALLGDERGREG